MRKILKYRLEKDGKTLKGNCFSTCVVNGLQLQQDPLVVGEKPELVVFNENVLSDFNEEKELAEALRYLRLNNYEIKIIDPEPLKNNLWGDYFENELLDGNPRNYEKNEIDQYINDGFCVILSTRGTNGLPHAILAFGSNIYDPEHEMYWDNPFSMSEYLERAAQDENGRFMIAFKKGS